ncbi:MAG: hypothetical protein SPI53_06230 [Erysipelotrichaceae bacterium]|nr:hypothetical protein [Erysipelotrichaceae bacterium]
MKIMVNNKQKVNKILLNFVSITICLMMFVTVFGINKTVSAQVVKTAQDTAYISKDNSNEAVEKAIRVYKEIDENTHSIKWTVKFNPGNENWTKGIFHYVWVPQKENAEMFVSREYSTGHKDEIKDTEFNASNRWLYTFANDNANFKIEYTNRIQNTLKGGKYDSKNITQAVALSNLNWWVDEGRFTELIASKERNKNSVCTWTFTTQHTPETNLYDVPIIAGVAAGDHTWPMFVASGPFGINKSFKVTTPEITEVGNINDLTTGEKAIVEQKIRAANDFKNVFGTPEPSLLRGIVIENDGTAKITYIDNTVLTIPGTDLVTKKPVVKPTPVPYPNRPAKWVGVEYDESGNINTSEQWIQNIQEIKNAGGSVSFVEGQGNAYIGNGKIKPNEDSNKNHVKVRVTYADDTYVDVEVNQPIKAINSEVEPKVDTTKLYVKQNQTGVENTLKSKFSGLTLSISGSELNGTGSDKVLAAVETKNLSVENFNSATLGPQNTKLKVTYKDGTFDEKVIPVVVYKTPVAPSEKMAVGNMNQLTATEMATAKNKIRQANPDMPAEFVIEVNANGKAFVKLPDNSTVIKEFTPSELFKTQAELTTLNNPTKTKVDNPSSLTTPEKEAVKKGYQGCQSKCAN